MTEEEFTDQLRAIRQRLHNDLHALVEKALADEGIDFGDHKPLPFAYSFGYDGETEADHICTMAGWLVDVVQGRFCDDKASVQHRVRKALGYGG